MNPKFEALLERRRSAARWGLFNSNWGSCFRCNRIWKRCKSHETPYPGGGCFPLCEDCWQDLTPEGRMPFYEIMFGEWELNHPVEEWKKEAIRKSVLASL